MTTAESIEPSSETPVRRIFVVLEMIKFSHTLFALPFALLAWVLASARYELRSLDLAGILLAMITARTAAMAFNRWADRRLDASNERTATRAIPAGRLSARFVLTFVAASSLLFVASTAIFQVSSGNVLPLALSPLVLAFLLGYSYAKRFTRLAHVWLGTALGLAPVCVWVAVSGELAAAPLVLAGVVVCWVTGFDILYACQDIEADRRLGLRSIPAALGFRRALIIARIAHAAMLALLVALWRSTPEFGAPFGGAVAIVAVLLVAEHALARHRDLRYINKAFFDLNCWISVLLLVAGSADILLS